MSVVIKVRSKFSLTDSKYANVLDEIVNKLKGRVEEAYIFGGLARNKINDDSDIDLILIKETDCKFVERPLEFSDLLDVFPEIDILVYTRAEFERQLEDSEVGFWKSVKNEMVKVL